MEQKVVLVTVQIRLSHCQWIQCSLTLFSNKRWACTVYLASRLPS